MLCVVVVVDVGRGLTACRLLMGAQAWNNYWRDPYPLLARIGYCHEYINYVA